MNRQQKNRLYFLIIVLTYFLEGLSLFGEQDQKGRAIKLYANLSLRKSITNYRNDTASHRLMFKRNEDNQFGYFSPAFSHSFLNGNFAELELSRFVINKTKNEVFIDSLNNVQIQSGLITKNVLIALRYEYNIMFFKKKPESKFKAYSGFSINPYFSSFKYVPINSALSSTKENQLGAIFAIVPRLNYNLNERWYMDMSLSCNILDISHISNTVENVLLPPKQRTLKEVDISILPGIFLFRLGIGVRL